MKFVISIQESDNMKKRYFVICFCVAILLAVLGIFLIFKTFCKNPEATSVNCRNSEELLQLLNIDFDCKVEALEYEQKVTEEYSATRIMVKLSFDRKAVVNSSFFKQTYEKPDIPPGWVEPLKNFGYGIDDIAETGVTWKEFVSEWTYKPYDINWIKPKNASNELIVYSSVPEILKMDKEGILKN